MDARLDPAKYVGLAEGDAHIIHHTNCGMELFTDEVTRDLLAKTLEMAERGPEGFTDVGGGPGSTEAKYIDWFLIEVPDATKAGQPT
jgi:carbonic anhydrase